MQWDLGIYIFKSSAADFDVQPGLGTAVEVPAWILASVP